MYRPKKTYTQGQITGNVKYGDKSVWDDWGKKQNERCKKAQFEESSKLCMCILKALDQEQVDLNKNRDLK